jgi:hypothetical protein
MKMTTEHRLTMRPISIRDATAYCARWHRHLNPPRGALFALSAYRDGLEPVGVILVGRPLARMQQDGVTCEVLRCTVPEGERNACSFLYGAAKRAAKALGYLRCVTKTLVTESGASLRAIGAVRGTITPGQSWDTPSRPRVQARTKAQLADKIPWVLFDERATA